MIGTQQGMKYLLVSLAVAAVLGAAGAAHAGPYAPAPRVVAKYERDFIERSGAQTLEELLDTGINRYFLTGGQPLLVLVNGRPYFTTSSDLDTLPLSAIERIELLAGDSLGTLGGSAVRGALNIVLRNDLDGVEVRAVARMPTRDGGDGWQGSAFWGGAIGQGRMTVGVDVLGREEITARSRAHSRSEWTEGGAFNEAQNVSVGGNTVWIIQRDEAGDFDGRPIGRPRGMRPREGLHRPPRQSPRHPLRRQGLRIRLRGDHVEHRSLRPAERDPQPRASGRRGSPPAPGCELHGGRQRVPIRPVGRLFRLHPEPGPPRRHQRRGRRGLRGGRERRLRRRAPLRSPRQPGLVVGSLGIRRLRAPHGPADRRSRLRRPRRRLPAGRCPGGQHLRPRRPDRVGDPGR